MEETKKKHRKKNKLQKDSIYKTETHWKWWSDELLEEYSCPTNYSGHYMLRTQAFKLIDKNIIMRNTYILNPI